MHRLFLIEASNNISTRLNVFIYVLLKIVDRNRRVIQVRKMLLTVLIQLKLWLLWSGWENDWILKSLGEGFQKKCGVVCVLASVSGVQLSERHAVTDHAQKTLAHPGRYGVKECRCVGFQRVS